MDYKPLKDAMVSYFRDMYYSLGNISQKVMDALNPSSGLENRLAFAGIPNGFVQGNNPHEQEYVGLYLFSKKNKLSFDDQIGAYAGTKKRPPGNIGNNKGIMWNDPNLSDAQRARLIFEAAGLKKSDPQYKRTSQPTKKDISWARQHLGIR